MTKILGRATIRVNDEFYDAAPGALLEPGGLRNNPRMTSHNFHHSQTLTPARVTCSVPLKPGMSLRALQEISAAEIHFEADTGQVFIIRNAAQTLQVSVSDGDQGGMVSLEFQGSPAEEMMQ